VQQRLLHPASSETSSPRSTRWTAGETTELIACVVAVLGVLITAATVDASDFVSQVARFYVTLLNIGYMLSRGLARPGSRNFYDDDRR
jgi:hypothetical protein